MQVLKSITFAYDAREDRILAAINAGRPEAWSCWLTRRLVLALLERATDFVTSGSPVAQRVAPEVRQEVAAFEREAAIVKTAPAMSRTPPEVVKSAVPSAELGQRLTLSHQSPNVRMEIHGTVGGAGGVLTREEFQRVLQMLQEEIVRCGWAVAAPSPGAAATPGQAPDTPIRH